MEVWFGIGIGRHMARTRYKFQKMFEQVCVKSQITEKKKLSLLNFLGGNLKFNLSYHRSRFDTIVL